VIFPQNPVERPDFIPIERFSSGVAGLDEMTRGGWLRNSIIIVRGPTGGGKTMLAGLYSRAGAMRGEPDDIRVFHKPLDLDFFFNRMDDIVALTKRRRALSRPRSPAPHRGDAGDQAPRPKAVKIDLVLYMSAASDKCARALKAIQSVLKEYRTDQISFTVRDLSTSRGDPPDDPIVFAPTLVKRGPGPRTWIIGNLDQPELLADLLDLSGVERKKFRPARGCWRARLARARPADC